MEKLQNTLENKLKFFAQYLFQTIYSASDEFQERYLFVLDPIRLGVIKTLPNKKDYLWLKPLSLITDEDAIEVCNIFRDEGIDNSGGLSLSFCNRYMSRIIQSTGAYQYLQSKGYALTWMGLSVEDLIEYGWIKLIEEKNGRAIKK